MVHQQLVPVKEEDGFRLFRLNLLLANTRLSTENYDGQMPGNTVQTKAGISYRIQRSTLYTWFGQVGIVQTRTPFITILIILDISSVSTAFKPNIDFTSKSDQLIIKKQCLFANFYKIIFLQMTLI